MNIIPTRLKDVLIVEPRVFADNRGFFMETFHLPRYRSLGIDRQFVQDNLSHSVKGTLRGLHFQIERPQAKLVQVVQGEIFDVAVDIRHGSPTFGQWVGEYLSSDNKRQFYIPPGFAHGFCVLSETALFTYLCTANYDRESDHSLRWDDPQLAIDWPLANVSLSSKDAAAPLLAEIADTDLPEYLGK